MPKPLNHRYDLNNCSHNYRLSNHSDLVLYQPCLASAFIIKLLGSKLFHDVYFNSPYVVLGSSNLVSGRFYIVGHWLNKLDCYKLVIVRQQLKYSNIFNKPGGYKFNQQLGDLNPVFYLELANVTIQQLNLFDIGIDSSDKLSEVDFFE